MKRLIRNAKFQNEKNQLDDTGLENEKKAELMTAKKENDLDQINNEPEIDSTPKSTKIRKKLRFNSPINSVTN